MAAEPKKDDEKNYITPAGFRVLQAEFEELRYRRREVVARLADAAAEGDRSENAEYIYRKKQLREIDRRLRFLARRMSIAEVIEPSQQRSQRVCFGALVTVEDQEGRTLRYQIVGVDETDPKQGRISWNSPIGRALVGKAVDDAVTVRWHAGERELTVLQIEFPRSSGAQAPVDAAALRAALGPGDGDDPADDDEDEEQEANAPRYRA